MPRTALTSLVVAGVLCGAFLLSALARAEDPPSAKPPAAPAPQKPIEQPLLKSLVGTWSIVQKSPFGENRGTATFALGVGGTALIEDYEVDLGAAGKFAGHGVFKPSADGTKLDLWWFDVHTPAPIRYTGSLTETGYEMKGENGVRLTLSKTGATVAFRLELPDGSSFTDTYTRK
jgi:hypothetical protein